MAYPLRKPLYETESSAKQTTVCVTGGTGYIAGAIIARLLAAGHTVHATVRDPNSQTKLQYLRSLPNAGTHLRFFKVIELSAYASLIVATVAFIGLYRGPVLNSLKRNCKSLDLR